MNRFNYERPATVAAAVAAGRSQGAAFLAGRHQFAGPDERQSAPSGRLVDISKLPGLNEIEFLADGGVRVGALVRNSDLAHDQGFAKNFPAVAEALLSGASAQLRNAATVAGNVMQRTRCPYFYDAASACNKREPGAGCDARGGHTRLQAVMGWSEHCIATHPSDFCVPLVAFDAVAEIDGPQGRRDVALEDFYLLPGNTPERETVLAAGELITAIRLPATAAGFAAHSRYLKIRDRTSYAFAVVSVAAGLWLDGDRIAEARLALGGVALKPWRAREAETSLVNLPPGRDAFSQAAALALQDARPSGDNDFKIELARRLVVRALERAAAKNTARLSPLPPPS